MAQVHAGQLGDTKLASTVDGGTALTTTRVFVPFHDGTHLVHLFTRNFVTGVVAQFSLCPYLIVLKTTDAFATDGNSDDFTINGQDDGRTFSMNSFDTAANNNFLYMGSTKKFQGVHVDLTNLNDTASVLTVKYWDGNSWEDISDTDGTDVAGDTFKQDGEVTWTIPSDWAITSLDDAGDVGAFKGPHYNTPLYWTRWEVSVVLDSTVSVKHLLAMAQDIAGYEMPVDKSLEFSVSKALVGYSGIEAEMNSDTGNLIINCLGREAQNVFNDGT